jgi:hypothetical protein
VAEYDDCGGQLCYFFERVFYDGVFLAGDFAFMVSSETTSCEFSLGYCHCDSCALHRSANDVEDCILGILTWYMANLRHRTPST